MKRELLDWDIALVSDAIALSLGLHFPESRWGDLKRGVASAARRFGFGADCRACASWLLSRSLTESQVSILASYFTVGETCFFRDSRSFEALTQHIIPGLIQQRQHGDRCLRIWSAACCTGEEPYSMAILLRRMVPKCTEWKITILGTDINPDYLRRAEMGLYSDWSFRGAPSWLKEQYFTPAKNGQFEMLPEIRRMVTFAPFNLADPSSQHVAYSTLAMDVVLCRNVLMYFTDRHVLKAMDVLSQAQSADGWLLVGPNEFQYAGQSKYAANNVNGTTIYRKRPRESVAVQNAVSVMGEGSLDFAESVLAGRGSALAIHHPRMLTPGESSGQGTAVIKGASNKGDLRAVIDDLVQNDDLQGALCWCDKWLASEKCVASIHYLHAGILQGMGCIEPASKSLGKALFLEPDFVMAHIMQGNLASQRRCFGVAKRHYRTSLQLLSQHQTDYLPPESGGLNAGHLSEMISSLMNRRKLT